MITLLILVKDILEVGLAIEDILRECLCAPERCQHFFVHEVMSVARVLKGTELNAVLFKSLNVVWS
jgi:hypothetical protein